MPGEVFVAWRSLNKVCARRFTTPGGWGTEVLVGKQAVSALPIVAAGPDGSALVLTPERNIISGSDDLHAYRYRPGAGWQAGSLVAENGSGATSAAIDSSGNAMIVWLHLEGTVQQIRASWYVAGTGWQTPVDLNVAGFEDSPARLSASADGSMFLILRRYNGAEKAIFVRRFVAASGWSVGALISPSGADITSSQSLAVDANGNAIAVWAQIQDSHTRVWASRYGP